MAARGSSTTIITTSFGTDLSLHVNCTKLSESRYMCIHVSVMFVMDYIRAGEYKGNASLPF